MIQFRTINNNLIVGERNGKRVGSLRRTYPSDRWEWWAVGEGTAIRFRSLEEAKSQIQ